MSEEAVDAQPQADAAQTGEDAATTKPDAAKPDATVDAKADAATPDATVDAKADAADAAVDAKADTAAPCADGGASLLTDPANCGSCGRSCANSQDAAGTCSAGECVPEIRVKGITSAAAEVVTNGTSTVYQDKDGIYKCDLPTCASGTTLLYSHVTLKVAGPMAIAGNYLNFAATDASGTYIGQCDLSISGSAGCGTSAKAISTLPSAMAADSSSLYVAVGNVIYRIQHTSLADLKEVVTVTSGWAIKAMALTPGYLLYARTLSGSAMIEKCGLYTLPCVPFSSGYPKAASAITAANDTFYWAYAPTIQRCAADAGCVQQFYVVDGGQVAASRIVADSRGVYWGGQDVFACLKAGGCTPAEVRHFVPAGSTVDAGVVSMVSVGWDLVWTYASPNVNSLQRVTAKP